MKDKMQRSFKMCLTDRRVSWKQLLVLMTALCMLWTGAPMKASAAEAMEMENICILRPGETYSLWARDNNVSGRGINLDRYEVVSTNKRVVRFTGTGNANTSVNIKGVRKGSARIKLRNKVTHKTVAVCKVIVAKYVRYFGGPKAPGSRMYYENTKVSGSQLVISGRLFVQRNHKTGKIKKIGGKKFRLTSKTMYGGYYEGIFESNRIGGKIPLNKALATALANLQIGCEIYVANGKVLLVGFIS